MSKKQTPAANPANPAPAAPQSAPQTPAGFDFRTAGLQFAQSEAQRAKRISELGEALKDCDLAGWTAARDAFIAGAKSVGYAAPEKLWERTISAGQEFGIIKDKPKAETPDASRMAESRKARAEDTRTVAELTAAAQELAGRNDLVGAGKLAKLAESKTKALATEAAKVAREATKADADAVRAHMAVLVKAGDKSGLAMLAKVGALLAAGQHAKVGAAIKGLRVPKAEPATV